MYKNITQQKCYIKLFSIFLRNHHEKYCSQMFLHFGQICNLPSEKRIEKKKLLHKLDETSKRHQTNA